ncbi:hypothetical protein LINPERHAP1_LOCUS17123 [Linum perenne]
MVISWMQSCVLILLGVGRACYTVVSCWLMGCDGSWALVLCSPSRNALDYRGPRFQKFPDLW